MLGLITRIFKKTPLPQPTVAQVPKPLPPTRRHLEISESAGSVEECLRQLERKAGLPLNDLSISKGEPIKIGFFPSGANGLRYFIVSETSEGWHASGKIGYISGSVTQLVGTVANNLLGSFFGSEAENYRYMGELFISENCPGGYKENVCTTCGHHLTR